MLDPRAILSDTMNSHRITIRFPRLLVARLKQRSRSEGKALSELVRIALERYLSKPKTERSAYDLAKEAGIIGCAKGLPKDLSTNPRHFKGFGKRRG